MNHQAYSHSMLDEDIELIARKLKLTNADTTLLKKPIVKSHFEYPTNRKIRKFLISAKERLLR
jgi:hypothetical protein